MSYDGLPSDSEPPAVVELRPTHLRELLSAARHYAKEPRDRDASARLILIRAIDLGCKEIGWREAVETAIRALSRHLPRDGR